MTTDYETVDHETAAVFRSSAQKRLQAIANSSRASLYDAADAKSEGAGDRLREMLSLQQQAIGLCLNQLRRLHRELLKAER